MGFEPNFIQKLPLMFFSFVRNQGLEPWTDGFGDHYSSQLSYLRMLFILHTRRDSNPQPRLRINGLEPSGHANERMCIKILINRYYGN